MSVRLKRDLKKVQEDYCMIRGYDAKTGVPTRERLEGLGLKDVADELERTIGQSPPLEGPSWWVKGTVGRSDPTEGV